MLIPKISSEIVSVADLNYEFSFVSFEKASLKLIFGYVQNHYSYLDSATPSTRTIFCFPYFNSLGLMRLETAEYGLNNYNN